MKEDKMRETYKNLVGLDIPDNPVERSVGQAWFVRSWEACAAIKDAEIAELEQAAQDEINRLEDQKLVLSEKIASRDLMIKELREAIQQMLDAQRLSTKYAPDNVEEAEKQLDRVKKAGNSAREALANSEHHNPSALEKKLLEAKINAIKIVYGMSADGKDDLIDEIKAKLAELNKE